MKTKKELAQMSMTELTQEIDKVCLLKTETQEEIAKLTQEIEDLINGK